MTSGHLTGDDDIVVLFEQHALGRATDFLRKHREMLDEDMTPHYQGPRSPKPYTLRGIHNFMTKRKTKVDSQIRVAVFRNSEEDTKYLSDHHGEYHDKEQAHPEYPNYKYVGWIYRVVPTQRQVGLPFYITGTGVCFTRGREVIDLRESNHPPHHKALHELLGDEADELHDDDYLQFRHDTPQESNWIRKHLYVTVVL